MDREQETPRRLLLQPRRIVSLDLLPDPRRRVPPCHAQRRRGAQVGQAHRRGARVRRLPAPPSKTL
eukprot:6226-Eustigmatos_ZCMA.PRE.1